MSLECGECERDLRGEHAPTCSRYSPAWTSGPWKVKPAPAGRGILIRAPDDLRHPQTHVQIAPIEDARVMAAAPALYRALRRFVRGRNCALIGPGRAVKDCIAAGRKNPCRICQAREALRLAGGEP